MDNKEKEENAAITVSRNGEAGEGENGDVLRIKTKQKTTRRKVRDGGVIFRKKN